MFLIEILTPERNFYQEEVDSVIMASPEGELEILTGHVPMVVDLLPDPIKIKKDGEWFMAALTKGFALVNADKVTILVEIAEWPEEIDINRANEEKQKAEEKLKHKMSKIEYLQTRADLQRALTELKVKGKNI